MAYIVRFPLGKKSPINVTTSQNIVDQLWQEFVILRHTRRPKTLSPFVDQARSYFLDAVRSDWRSAGLLYYYSFLNLAKALLLAKRVFSYKKITQSSLYHGLSASPQTLSSIADFEIEIHPTTSGGRDNVFAHFYRRIANQLWPFANRITVRLRDVCGYCFDIGASDPGASLRGYECKKLARITCCRIVSFSGDELSTLYGIAQSTVIARSLLRQNNTQGWFEILANSGGGQVICNQVQNWALTVIPFANLTPLDKQDWLLAFHLSAEVLSRNDLLRSPQQPLGNSAGTVMDRTVNLANRHLRKYAVPTASDSSIAPFWFFVPDLTLGGRSLRWHPILSDYLFSFGLSTILRYHPHLVVRETKDFVLGEAWCRQSPVTALRYFLMQFTDPPRRILSYD